MSKKKQAHHTTVKKRTLFGSRKWWATCSCGKWYQGCDFKQDAGRLASEHKAKGEAQ